MNNLLILNSMWKSFHHNSRGRTLKLDLLVTNALQNVLYLIAMLHSSFLETTMSKIYASKDSYFRKQECLKNVKESNTWDQPSHKILWLGSVCVLPTFMSRSHRLSLPWGKLQCLQPRPVSWVLVQRSCGHSCRCVLPTFWPQAIPSPSSLSHLYIK